MTSAASEQHDRRVARKVLLSSLIGSTVEWYEFFIYGTAASLVFGDLFFPEFDPLVGTLLSLSTFAIAFVARPVGGVLFGHFGDRLGRKSMLVLTLTLMGGATFALGLLPTYDQVGVAAPVLLVLVRLVQGLSLGGEYGGAVLMSVEHADQRRKGLYGAVVNTGVGWGLLLANLLFLIVTQLPDAAFRTWGWRIPFLLSAVLVGLGLFIRLKVTESPDFQAVKESGEVRRLPVVEVMRKSPGLVVLMCLAYVSTGATFYVLSVFSLAYGEDQVGVGKSTMLGLVLGGTALTIVAVPYFGLLSDRLDRRRILLAGITAMAVLPFAWFTLLHSGNTLLMLAGFLLLFLAFSVTYGAMPTFFAHVFPVDVRYTGMSAGYTLGTVLGGGFAPIIAAYLLDRTGDWPAIAWYMTAAGAVSFVAALFLRERPDDVPGRSDRSSPSSLQRVPTKG
ncbi:MHS family MFS transporter [Streptomyces sp. NBC_01619]|uniref:MFS transporter n=2 Tax=unclassified Streptomyces TaxID=2593676 RepID=UPI00224CC2E4|nr:MFS transporter [Streptomyces sp. NBC_01619]MCX4514262.1 MHS family MFS transporter [Streptomyces sp. NBC_01619]